MTNTRNRKQRYVINELIFLSQITSTLAANSINIHTKLSKMEEKNGLFSIYGFSSKVILPVPEWISCTRDYRKD